MYSYVGYAFGSVGGEAQSVIRNVIIALVALATISLLPVVIKKVRARRGNGSGALAEKA